MAFETIPALKELTKENHNLLHFDICIISTINEVTFSNCLLFKIYLEVQLCITCSVAYINGEEYAIISITCMLKFATSYMLVWVPTLNTQDYQLICHCWEWYILQWDKKKRSMPSLKSQSARSLITIFLIN